MGIEHTGTADSTFNNLTNDNISGLVIDYTVSDCIENDREPIFELLKPNEIYILYKDSSGIVYLGNEDGKLFIEKSLWKDTIESE